MRRKPQSDYLAYTHGDYPREDLATFRREAVPPVPFIQPGLNLFQMLGLIMRRKTVSSMESSITALHL